MRDRNTIPLTSLIVLALIPAVLLGGVWGLAEANEPPATTTTTTTLPPPPVDEMTTEEAGRASDEKAAHRMSKASWKVASRPTSLLFTRPLITSTGEGI